MSAQPWEVVRILAVGFVALGLSGVGHALVVDPGAGLALRVRRHAERLGRKLTFLRAPISGPQLVALQVGTWIAIGLWGLAASPVAALVLLPLPWAVDPWLSARVDARLEAMNQQLESWLLALVGSLSSGASLGQALEESADLIEAPLGDEVRRACRELALGVSVPEALQRMAERAPSATLATAVAAIRIGQRTGGSLASLLKRSAETLREMARLEGVVRSRTAEGRAQATVVAALPLPTVALLYEIDPTLLQPLWRNPAGVWVLLLALVLWLAAVALARKVLHVDI